nr:PIN domain-containing protein [Microbacterium pseudoresistens]
MTRGIIDTSVLIAGETGRRLNRELLPTETATTVITLAELRLGVLAAPDAASRSRRLDTVESISNMLVFDVDDAAARVWASLRITLRDRNRRMSVNDLWIAAIASANHLPVVTQDTDFDALDGVAGIEIIRV